jgi:hypothetical protein
MKQTAPDPELEMTLQVADIIYIYIYSTVIYHLDMAKWLTESQG